MSIVKKFTAQVGKNMNSPYKACHTSKDGPPYLYGIDGPGDGLGYYAWYLYPEHFFSSLEDAERVAALMNLAFECGKRARSDEIKQLIGT
jgi:hypothetical protein